MAQIQTQNGPNERLFIFARTHSMQIFGEIPLSRQNFQAVNKRQKLNQNKIIIFSLIFHRF